MRKVGLFLGTFVGTLALCCIGSYAAIRYSTSPRPSPASWPGATVQVWPPQAPGSFGLSQRTTYTVQAALEDIQQYYDREMAHYCEEPRSWMDMDENGMHCVEVRGCRIRRIVGEQYFFVTLCELGDQLVDVEQSNLWAD